MPQRRFYLELFFITAASAAALRWAHLQPQLQSYSALSWVSLAFFVLLTLLIYHAGQRALASNNKKAFTQLVMVGTVGKMMASVLIILVYMRLAHPESRWFVAPFLGLYLVYTAYETYMMMALGRSEGR